MSSPHTPTRPSLEQALTDLPPKLRVHELAKRAGAGSKDIIAALAEAGITVSSAASSVSSADATTVLTALLAIGDQQATPREAEPDIVGAIEQAEPEPDPGFFAAPLFLPPAEAKPARRRRATKAAHQEPTLAEGDVAFQDTAAQATTEIVFEPAADAADQDQAETGTSRSGRRRRGRSSSRARADQSSTADELDEQADTDHSRDESERSAASAATAPDPTGHPATPEGSIASDAGDQGDHDGAADEDDNDPAATRRRRRGRRGRGRVGDERPDDQNENGDGEAGPAVETTGDIPAGRDAVGDEAEDDDSGDDAGTRRRRRRRRRSGSAEGGSDENNREDDPDNTVVHLREPRSAGTAASSPATGSSSSSEVQGVRGSTRLEAKRQRRRDSRGSRSRPQILTEAEFLARREAVDRVMAVRQRGGLAQVALLEDGVLVEHFVSRAGSESLMGNIYLGRVQNVLPSMEAAFVDIGKGRNAVLYAGEVNWDAAGLAGKARRIETALSGGDTMLVQVSKDPVGQKGARLTTQISLPGRFLVYVPAGGATGISRKLPDTERKRLKSILDRIVPEDAGVIIRTAAEGVAEDELARDVDRLKTQWQEISRQAEKKSNAPLLLSAEPDTLIKVIRDLFNSDISRLVLDGEGAYESVSSYINGVAPELANRVSRYDGPNDVFAAYRIDEQIAKALERKVYLPSGGSLVIDRTEAMTVVDVNTGKYTGSGGNLEETVTKNNLEAAEEVVRQLRLRDIGGIIVVDFIDMVLEANRELVMRRLTECLGRDRTRHQVAEVTSLGLIQMTRKKMGTGLVEAFSEPCPHCHGRGIIVHDVPTEDRSGAHDHSESDADRRARGRRGKGRQDIPTPERDPIVKIVPATVRPPDPRGPKPPVIGGDEHLEHDEPAAAIAGNGSLTELDRYDTDPIFEPAAGSTGDLSAGDAGYNVPMSRDASDAVSAVLAALDARAERQNAGTPEASQQDADAAGAGTAPSTSGRRRGRRAAGRPAGAPAASSASGPIDVPPADDQSRATAAEPADAPPDPAPEVLIADVRPDEEAAAPEAAVAAALGGTGESFDLIVDPVEEAEPVRRGRGQTRRRGSRAAGAAAPATSQDLLPSNAPVDMAAEAKTNGHPNRSNGTTSGTTTAPAEAGVADAGAGVADADPGGAAMPVKAAPPRRRRASSRPAGPAAAPEPVPQN